MKFLSTVFLALFLFAFPALAEERIDLTVPDQAQAGTMTYSFARLTLDWEHGRVVVVLVGANGERKEVVFGDADGARALMRSFNKADFSSKSLHRRLMEKLIAEGHLVGAIAGAPD